MLATSTVPLERTSLSIVWFWPLLAFALVVGPLAALLLASGFVFKFEFNFELDVIVGIELEPPPVAPQNDLMLCLLPRKPFKVLVGVDVVVDAAAAVVLAVAVVVVDGAIKSFGWPVGAAGGSGGVLMALVVLGGDDTC